VGLGRLGGAGRSTVPIACGDDELGTPAQPVTMSPSVASATNRRFTRFPFPEPNGAGDAPGQRVSAEVGSS
jgi:hypothetical protein